MFSFDFSALPAQAQEVVQQAGWFAGRNGLATGQARLPTDVVYPAELLLLLAEFTGLRVGSGGPGITMTRTIIEFDPFWTEGENGPDTVRELHEEITGTKLYPLGYSMSSHAAVVIGANGCVYISGDGLMLMGSSFTEGLSNILLGVRGKLLE